MTYEVGFFLRSTNRELQGTLRSPDRPGEDVWSSVFVGTFGSDCRSPFQNHHDSLDGCGPIGGAFLR